MQPTERFQFSLRQALFLMFMMAGLMFMHVSLRDLWRIFADTLLISIIFFRITLFFKDVESGPEGWIALLFFAISSLMFLYALFTALLLMLR